MTVISNDVDTFNVVDPVVNDRGIGQRLWTAVGANKAIIIASVRIVIDQQEGVVVVGGRGEGTS